MKKSIALLKDLIEPTIEALGVELWGIEHQSQGKFSTLRIYIDASEGIDIDDCEKISRQVSAILDVEEPIGGEYTLEVSSPGLDRPLFTAEQFAKFNGNQVNLRTRTPIEGRRKFKGQIQEVRENVVCLDVDGTLYEIPHTEIEKANIVYEQQDSAG